MIRRLRWLLMLLVACAGIAGCGGGSGLVPSLIVVPQAARHAVMTAGLHLRSLGTVGAPLVGDVLSSTSGTWTGCGNCTYTYSWKHDLGAGYVTASGAPTNTNSYTIVNGDVGATIEVIVTATNSAGSTSATSIATGIVAVPGSPPAIIVLPAVSGTTTQGQVLTASAGTWAGAPTSYAYQWQDCNSGGASCVNIGGATSTAYTLASGDVGDTIRAVVTARNAYGSTSASSAATAVIAASGTPPVNTVIPTVSGTAQQGSTLTATTGTWTGTASITYTYQWRSCNSSGASCVDIAGATASTYLLVVGDVGNTIRAAVKGTNAYGNATGTSNQTAVITAAPSAPTNTTIPAVSGTTTQGQTLTTNNGSWTGSPTSYIYQWRRCNSSGASCADIAGATSSGYVLVVGDVGSTIRSVVTATNATGSTSATSNQTAVVAASGTAPVNTVIPAVSGTTTQGSTLTTDNGSWTGLPTSYTYQWRACDSSGASCVDIAGATANTYLLVIGDVGNTIRAVVTATNATGSTSATSNQTTVISGGSAPVNTASPAINGVPTVGNVLTTTTGTWVNTPTSYTYQWQDCTDNLSTNQFTNCTNAGGSGATTSSYTMAAGDTNASIHAVVTAHNGAGTGAASGITGPEPVNFNWITYGGNLPHANNCGAAHSSTCTDTQEARRYQWINYQPGDITSGRADSLLVANPNLWLTPYKDSLASNTANPSTPIECTNYTTDSTSHSDWFLYADSAASTKQFIYGQSGNNEYVMDVGNTAYQNACFANNLATIQGDHADAYYADNVGQYPLNGSATAYTKTSHNGQSGSCTGTLTGSSYLSYPWSYPWTCWSDMEVNFFANAHSYFAANGINVGIPNIAATYSNVVPPTSVADGVSKVNTVFKGVIDRSRGAMDQAFTSGSGATMTSQDSSVPASMSNQIYAEQNHDYIWEVPVFSSSTVANSEGANAYSLALMLQAANGYSSYTTTPCAGAIYSCAANWFPEPSNPSATEYDDALQLGPATGNFQYRTVNKSGGGTMSIYERDFTNGVVLANPTTNTTLSFAPTPGGTYAGRDCSNPSDVSSCSQVTNASTVTLGPNAGAILLR